MIPYTSEFDGEPIEDDEAIWELATQSLRMAAQSTAMACFLAKNLKQANLSSLFTSLCVM